MLLILVIVNTLKHGLVVELENKQQLQRNHNLPKAVFMPLSKSCPLSLKITNNFVRLTAVVILGMLLENCSR